MEYDKLEILKGKLFELKKYRDILQNETAYCSQEITQLEESAGKIKNALESHKRIYDEKNQKIKRVDAIINESEGAMRKLTENARKLENVIERELSTNSFK